MTKGPSELRAFLEGLAGIGQSPSSIPSVLYRMASRVLHGRQDAVQDLVGDAILDLLERKGAGSVRILLDLNDDAMARAMLQRLRQKAAEQGGPRWRLYKGLAEMVKRALAMEPLPVEALPVSLVSGDRVRFHLVREGVSALLSRQGPPPRTVATVTQALMREYFGGEQTSETILCRQPAPGDVADEVIAAADAATIARRARRDLPANHLATLRERARGASLGSIARRQGVAVSTACTRAAHAVEALAAWASQTGLDAASMAPALALLAQQRA